ncbi:unnamed protein product [Urochloa humidicola]
MTKKHKIRKSKHLLESKKDVDENVENILRMIGEENEQIENEQDDSGNPVKKSKLSSLVKGFHEEYEYLHKHYKQLISKLENVGHSSSGSDSSDSDIEGDRSNNDVATPKVAPNEENGLDHKPAEYHSLEAEIAKLKQTTEEQAKEISNLKHLLDITIKDKEATSVELSSEVANLSSENENLKVLLETAKREEGELLNTVKSKESEVTTLSSEKQIIEEERDNLKILIVDMEKEKEDMRNQLKDTVDKCNLLSSELEKAQQVEKEVQTLLEENQKLKNDNMILLVEHDNLKALHQNLYIECSKLKEAIAETCAENESLIRENHSAERRLQQLGVERDGLKVEVVELTNNLDKERSTAAEEKQRLVSENSMYLNELEKAQSSVKDLEKDLESTKNVLNSNITELEKEKNFATSEIEQLEASLMNLKTELAQQLERISDMQKINTGLELANSNLHNEIVEVQGQKNEAAASVIDLESKLEQQAQENSNLQEANKDLKTVKADLYNEVTSLQEEKNAALSQLQQSEANINNLQSDLEQLQNQNLLFQQENEELQNKNSSLYKQMEEIRTILQGEITVLQGEKEEAINSLQQSNDSVKALGVQLEQRVEKISVLQLANEDLQNCNSNLKMQLEEAKLSLQAEILALQDEKNKILLDLQQSEACIKNLRIELEESKEQISIMNLANEDLKNDIAILDKQLEEVRSSLHAEIARLHAEKDTTLSELQTSHASFINLESVLEKQNEKISTLDQANDELQKNIRTLIEESEQAKVELEQEVKATQEEKHVVLTQLKQSEESVQSLENEVIQLKEELSVQLENNSTLDKQLEEATLKVSNLHENLEKAQAEAACKIDDMTTKKKDLEKTTDLLSYQKIKLEEDLKIMIEACTVNLTFMTEFEDRVTQKISDHVAGIVVLHQSLRGVASNCQRLQYAYDEVSSRVSQLEILKRSQIDQIDQLEEKHTEHLGKRRLLEEENLSASKENTKLQKHVQELEVQLQLAKQKLKVTEAESKCKEDSYATAMETSQAEIHHLEQLVQQFSGKVSLLEETLMQVNGNAESEVSELTNKLYKLESLFSQSFTLFVDRSSACSEELKVLRKKLHDHLDEHKELVKENDEMAARLREKEKMVLDMGKSAAEAEAKMDQLEKAVAEKEEELAHRVQEKREAIKQLSDTIVYHKNYSDDLVRYIRSHNRPRLPFCL